MNGRDGSGARGCGGAQRCCRYSEAGGSRWCLCPITRRSKRCGSTSKPRSSASAIGIESAPRGRTLARGHHALARELARGGELVNGRRFARYGTGRAPAQPRQAIPRPALLEGCGDIRAERPERNPRAERAPAGIRCGEGAGARRDDVGAVNWLHVGERACQLDKGGARVHPSPCGIGRVEGGELGACGRGTRACRRRLPRGCAASASSTPVLRGVTGGRYGASTRIVNPSIWYLSGEAAHDGRGAGLGREGRRKMAINPMRSAHAAPRCGARTRAGGRCKAPAMANGRCRMHGGKLPGAPRGNRHAWKHGRYSGEAFRRRREVPALVGEMRSLVSPARDVRRRAS